MNDILIIKVLCIVCQLLLLWQQKCSGTSWINIMVIFLLCLINIMA